MAKRSMFKPEVPVPLSPAEQADKEDGKLKGWKRDGTPKPSTAAEIRDNRIGPEPSLFDRVFGAAVFGDPVGDDEDPVEFEKRFEGRESRRFGSSPVG